MGQTLFDPQESEFTLDGFNCSDNELWYIQFQEFPSVTWYFSQTGEPHLVTFDEFLDEQLRQLGLAVNAEGYQRLFPQGMSLNVVNKLNEDLLSVVTFERGVNRITKACGTGSTCSVAVASQRHIVGAPEITVQTRGGEMTIAYDRAQRTSVMTGPAELNAEKYELTVIEEEA